MSQSKSSASKASAEKPALTLEEFMREKARVGCPVCQLPAAVRAQLGKSATRKGFTRDDQVAWLRTACGATGITVEILAKHLTARHDTEEEINGGA